MSKITIETTDSQIEAILRAAIVGVSQEDLVLTVGVVLGEALVATLPDELKSQAIDQFDALVDELGYETASGSVFALLAGMSLRCRRDEAK